MDFEVNACQGPHTRLDSTDIEQVTMLFRAWSKEEARVMFERVLSATDLPDSRNLTPSSVLPCKDDASKQGVRLSGGTQWTSGSTAPKEDTDEAK
jgi:hypothetical protein